MNNHSTEQTNCSIIGESFTTTVLDNGLTVICCERPDTAGIYACFAAGIGSNLRSFEADGQAFALPAGTAHYLEHKLFAGKKGDAFELFAKTGANANAYTSFERTCYVFSSNDSIDEPLSILLEFVTSPYFTKQNVDKERGIIGQELSMYDDNAEFQLLLSTLKQLYSVHPVRDDIGGTEESISHITRELLYTAYNAFYTPKNMVLAVAGKITNEHLLEICAASLPANWGGSTGRALPVDEPSEIVTARGSRQMAVGSRQFCIGFKELPITENRLKIELASDILSELISGESSDFYNEMYDLGLVNSTYYSESLDGDGYFCNFFGGESDDPEEVLRRIKARINYLKNNGIDPDRFTEAKRSAYGDAVLDFDSNSDIATALSHARLRHFDIRDAIEETLNITIDDIEQLLSRTYREDYCTMFVIEPTERK